MKCPTCGQEIKTGQKCENCGNTPASSPGMEVEYKDFKVSELLDIKMRKPAPAKKETPKTETVGKKHEVRLPAGKKRSWPLVTVFILVIVLILLFLLRFLLKF